MKDLAHFAINFEFMSASLEMHDRHAKEYVDFFSNFFCKEKLETVVISFFQPYKYRTDDNVYGNRS